MMLVDDERRFVDSLARRLSIRGYASRVAYDGESALRALDEGGYLAMVLDLRLPDLHGTEVLARALRMTPSLAVIILTAHGNQEDERLCMARGAVAFLNKPLQLDRLLELLTGLEASA